MRRLLFLLFIFSYAYGQTIITQPYLFQQYITVKDSVAIGKRLRIPNDTTVNKLGIAQLGNILYAGNGSYWTGLGSGGAYSAGYGLNLTGSTFKADTTKLLPINDSNRLYSTPTKTNTKLNATDTASLSYRINTKLDTVYKVNDSTIGISKNGVSSSFTINTNGSLLNSDNYWKGINSYNSISIRNLFDTTKYLTLLHYDTTDNGSGRNGVAFFPPVTPHGIAGNDDTVAYQSWVQQNASLNSDTIPLATFGGGSGISTDTAAFNVGALYGSFYNSDNVTLTVSKIQIVLQGTSPSITVNLYYGTSLNSGGTAINSGGTVCSNTSTGTSVSGLNIKIAPNNWVWCTSNAITTKPTYLSATIIGTKKYN
jgi:hypothetical protein